MSETNFLEKAKNWAVENWEIALMIAVGLIAAVALIWYFSTARTEQGEQASNE